MATRKRLLIFVEGDGDQTAAPVLVKHLLTEQAAWDCLSLDEPPWKVGNVANLIRSRDPHWRRYLKAAAKDSKLGGILLLLDGDLRLPKKEPFCARDLGGELSRIAIEEGAGIVFSVATVFALQEFESWLIGGVLALAGQLLSPDDRPGVAAEAVPPEQDLEIYPRDAKGWLREHMGRAYKETLDQEPLTRLLVKNLDPLRQRGMRSFRRLETAVAELVEAIRSGNHIVTPAPP